MITENEHIALVSETVYGRAYLAALMEVKKDRRLIGLDKFRHQLAREAALRATGYPQRPLILKRSLGHGDADSQRVGEEILAQAIKAAEKAVPKQ